jgi:hypothetical protein
MLYTLYHTLFETSLNVYCILIGSLCVKQYLQSGDF